MTGARTLLEPMNYSDLLVVVALASGLYGLMVALARQRHFLTRAVNPYRWPWLLAGFTCAWFGVGLLRLEAKSWSPGAMGEVLAALVTDKPLSTQGKVASVALLMGMLLMLLVVWCRFNFPRDPITFRSPRQRWSALRYYVTKLRGGLDYAVLMRPGGERVEEAWHEKHMVHTLPHLPQVPGPGGVNIARTVDDQIAFWRATAIAIDRSMASLDQLLEPAHHGGNRRIIFDTEYGGLLFAYLRPPIPGKEKDALFLFAATLSQEAMNTKQADAHFDLLMKALRQIDTTLRMA